jgi:Zn-dependent protease
VLLLEPNETPYDLRWRMFGIPVRVHPMFWILSLFWGGNRLESGVEYLLVWVGCVFVSVLIHELGHVVMGLAFGRSGRIVLYSFGGLAIGSNNLSRRWQRIAVSFAGPLAGFLFLAAILAVLWLKEPPALPFYLELLKSTVGLPLSPVPHVPVLGPLAFTTILDLMFINLFWGLINLLPIWPLDGGQISRDVCEGALGRRGLNLSLGISLVVSGIIAIHCVMSKSGRPLIPFLPIGSWYSAIFFGLFAVQSFQLLQHAERERRWQEDYWDRWDR